MFQLSTVDRKFAIPIKYNLLKPEQCSISSHQQKRQKFNVSIINFNDNQNTYLEYKNVPSTNDYLMTMAKKINNFHIDLIQLHFAASYFEYLRRDSSTRECPADNKTTKCHGTITN